MNARDDEVRAAARLLESRLQQAAKQLPTSPDYDWRLQEHPMAGVTTEAITTTSVSWEERSVSGMVGPHAVQNLCKRQRYIIYSLNVSLQDNVPDSAIKTPHVLSAS